MRDGREQIYIHTVHTICQSCHQLKRSHPFHSVTMAAVLAEGSVQCTTLIRILSRKALHERQSLLAHLLVKHHACPMFNASCDSTDLRNPSSCIAICQAKQADEETVTDWCFSWHSGCAALFFRLPISPQKVQHAKMPRCLHC